MMSTKGISHGKDLENTILKEKEIKILDFLFYWGRPIKAGELVKQLNVKHSTLNSVLKRLTERQFIIWEKYGVVHLTKLGTEKAAHITNHHFIIEKFLKDSLNISDEFAHKEALNLSRLISCELIEKICEKYKYCPNTMNYNFCEPRNYEIR
jgi:DtxR family Mn-dependent transcriptional regulator